VLTAEMRPPHRGSATAMFSIGPCQCNISLTREEVVIPATVGGDGTIRGTHRMLDGT